MTWEEEDKAEEKKREEIKDNFQKLSTSKKVFVLIKHYLLYALVIIGVIILFLLVSAYE